MCLRIRILERRGNSRYVLYLALTVVLFAGGLLFANAQEARQQRALLLTSIDGFKPEYVLQADAHHLLISNLRQLIADAIHAHSNNKQQTFLDSVLAHCVGVEMEELDQES
ncbi:MAG: hypothetical protein ABI076_09145 [Acidobacteriaceae bacterium]